VIRTRLSAFVTALTLLVAAAAGAHDIPSDVTVQAFLTPEGRRIRLIVRVPLDALRDMGVPTSADGVMDLPRLDPMLADNLMLWIGQNIDLYEHDARLPAPRLAAWQLSLPGDRSFASYDAALAHVTGARLPAETKLYWPQAVVDALFEYPIQSDRSRFAIHPRLARLGLHTLTVLHFLTPDGQQRVFEYPGDPGLVRLDPRWDQSVRQFVTRGFFRCLDGTDGLLFLLCLVIPFRRVRTLVPIVAAFSVAQSIALVAGAYRLSPDGLWFLPLIETLIAASIVYAALENIGGTRSVERRWVLAFSFGLAYGFSFASGLPQTLQFAGSHVLASVLSFGGGIGLGQLLVLALAVPALELFFRFVVAERVGTIVLSALIAHTGWHRMLDRWDLLRQYRWPVLDALAMVTLMRWLMAGVILAAGVWLVTRLRLKPDSEVRLKPDTTHDREKGAVPLFR
jgi:hypothetical protein